jgi:hypothetical protein
MRKRFEQQFVIGRLPIEDTEIPTQKRSGALPSLCAALKEIFITPKWNEKVFEILEKKIQSGKRDTGRQGMDLWHIFVLSQVRLCQNISYDELHHIANYDSLIRQIMGIESGFGHEKVQFSYRSIHDNVSLLDDETVKELNEVIVEFGHEVFKKKEGTALRLKTDSFVVKSNVHFPTDYNLLWDSARKSIDMVNKFHEKYNIEGWRKIKNWRRELKNKMRALGQASVSGGKWKQERVKQAARSYLGKAKALYQKLEGSKDAFPQQDIVDLVIYMELERFIGLLKKHIDLLERRIIKGEEIPHREKMFSIFEDYTEWITKGKMHPNVELGKKTAITTDQFHLIIDYRVMDHQSDSEIVKGVADELTGIYSIASWSFDKGFWHKENKALLKTKVDKIIMPKKGKRNKQEEHEEKQAKFKILKNKHSAIESNINELKNRGLSHCPDKGFENFKRYIGLAVSAYNLRKIGAELIAQRIAIKHETNNKIAA